MMATDKEVLEGAAGLIERYGLAHGLLGDRTMGFCAIGAINAALNGRLYGAYDARTMDRSTRLVGVISSALDLPIASDAIGAVVTWSNKHAWEDPQDVSRVAVAAGLRRAVEALE